MKKLMIAAICLSLAITAFALSGCAKKEQMSGWVIKEHQADGVALQNYAVLRLTMPSHTHVTGHSHTVKEVRMNVSGSRAASVTLAFSSSSTITSPKKLNCTVNPAEADDNGWVKVLTDQTDLSYTYVEIALSQTLTINEVVFITVDGEAFTLAVQRAGVRAEGSTNSQLEWTAAELQELIDDAEKRRAVVKLGLIGEEEVVHNALCLIDEQDKFKA